MKNNTNDSKTSATFICDSNVYKTIFDSHTTNAIEMPQGSDVVVVKEETMSDVNGKNQTYAVSFNAQVSFTYEESKKYNIGTSSKLDGSTTAIPIPEDINSIKILGYIEKAVTSTAEKINTSGGQAFVWLFKKQTNLQKTLSKLGIIFGIVDE
ncbi:MAG: hypothetical protein WCT19_01670 [Candidatus Paceibacterota bacterium]|jgi:hypothetical protein